MRALIEVLLEHRRLPTEVIVAALAAANTAGITNPQVVITDARAAADRRPPAEVIPIGGGLEVYDRPPPDVAGYDTLLAAAVAGGRP